MLNMHKQITIKTLKKQGLKISQIAKELNCHRNTVRNILNQKEIKEIQTRNKPSYFDQHKKTIQELLDKKINYNRIYEILKEEHNINQTYVNLCNYIRKNFETYKEAFGVQERQPAEEAEVDFGYAGVFPDNQNHLKKHWFIVITLAYSRLAFYDIIANQKVEDLIKGLKDAFQYFQGVPKRIKVDNAKAAVIKNKKYDLLLNQDFLEFSHHYGFVVKPCPPFKPNEKGKVENGVKYFKTNFLNGRTFNSTAEAKEQCQKWMKEKANKRIHGTTQKIPEEIFNQNEKSKLLPLPENEFSFFNRAVRTVRPNCHINFENNYYSVPSNLILKNVIIRWNRNTLKIVFNNEEVAVHLISKQKGQYITNRAHLPKDKYYSETEYQAKIEDQMKEIGEYAHQYFKEILIKREIYWFGTVRRIMKLKEEYGKEVVNLALKRALTFGAIKIPIIRNICEKQLYQLDNPKKLQTRIQDNTNRDLNYYQELTK